MHKKENEELKAEIDELTLKSQSGKETAFSLEKL